jgi:hypothetical protein
VQIITADRSILNYSFLRSTTNASPGSFSFWFSASRDTPELNLNHARARASPSVRVRRTQKMFCILRLPSQSETLFPHRTRLGCIL